MINQELERKIIKSSPVLPRYQDYCFANLHQTIINLLTGSETSPKIPSACFPKGNFSHIFLIIIDGLGYSSFKKFGHYFSLPSSSIISPLTTIFPSTTAAALSTFSTGLLPSEHGLFEWRLYSPQVGKVVKTLPFCLEESHQQDELATSIDPEKFFFDSPTIYEKLKRAKIPSFTFNHQSYYKSTFGQVNQKGAKKIPFTNLAELMTCLDQTSCQITSKHKKTFTYIYIDSLDYISHKYGPSSPYFESQLAQIALMLKRFFIKPQLTNKTSGRKLLLISADHGQIDVEPQKTIYLDGYRKLKNNLAYDKDNQPIMATGGPRDVFFHLKKDQANKIIPYLRKKLANQAWVYSIEEAVKMGLFGYQPIGEKFIQRAGDVLIIPQENKTIWLKGRGNKKVDKLGHHGGLSPEEMIIPLIAVPL